MLDEGIATWPNFRVDFGSSNGYENNGVIDALNDMLMQSWRGYIELFPCWPASKPGAFRGLRARGAFLVDASFTPPSAAAGGQSVHSVQVTSEAARVPCIFLSPWAAGQPKPLHPPIVVCVNTGKKVDVVQSGLGDNIWSFATTAGHSYTIKAG